MDKFTRIYSAILAAVVVAVSFWVLYESPGVSKLNGLLSKNTELVDYPYRFRVLELQDGVATMSTPRSADFPAHRALVILYPALRNERPDSPAMLDAQQEMARMQGTARSIVAGSSDVDRVVWKLDENWLRARGVDPDHP